MVNRGAMGANSLPKTVTRQRRGCDLNPHPSARESSTLTTRLPRHPCMKEPAGRNTYTSIRVRRRCRRRVCRQDTAATRTPSSADGRTGRRTQAGRCTGTLSCGRRYAASGPCVYDPCGPCDACGAAASACVFCVAA